jgi:hypothetical protein
MRTNVDHGGMNRSPSPKWVHLLGQGWGEGHRHLTASPPHPALSPKR